MNLRLNISKLILHQYNFIQLASRKLLDFYYKVYKKTTFKPEYEIILDYYLSKIQLSNLKDISIIEFGVASGKSLKYLELISKKYQNKYNININIFGFDTFEGMPSSNNKHDQLYDWKENDFSADINLVKKDLKKSILIKGNVKDTVNNIHFSDIKIKNVALIFFDLDYFSSTNHAFNIFNKNMTKFLLPRVGLFFDNLHSSTEFSGEYLSIKQFNSKNKKDMKFITKDFYLEKFDNRFYQFLNFNHKDFNKNYNKRYFL